MVLKFTKADDRREQYRRKINDPDRGLSPEQKTRKQAARQMKAAGVQSLSGLSGAGGQVARFKTEQNQLRNEYNDPNTSEDRKEEIIQDLRGVSADLNRANRADAYNRLARAQGINTTFFTTSTGFPGIVGTEPFELFNRFRGEFAKNQGDFKREDPDLFRAVHPNRVLQTLGGIAQAYKALSPTGLVQNTGKILRGEPLFEIESMKKNTSESPSRFKNFYSAYMKTQNDKIKDLNNQAGDAVPMDPGFKRLIDDTPISVVDDVDVTTGAIDDVDTITERFDPLRQDEEARRKELETQARFDNLIDTINADDGRLSPNVDTTADQEEDDDLDLTNLYSLTQQPTITDDLVAGAFEERDDVPGQTTEGIREQIDINTADPNVDLMTSDAFLGSDTFPAEGVDRNLPDSFYPDTDLDLSVGDQRRAFDILNKAKGGSVDAYNVLKLINDTMNDGQT